MELLNGKKVLILGIADEYSIAWGIAKQMKAHGASLGLSYLNEKLKTRVVPLSEEVGADFIFEMDVTVDDHYNNLKDIVQKHWGKFDVLVHSLAFCDREDLKGRFCETTRSGFSKALDVSAFSLVSLSNSLKDLMNKDASIMAMTFHGSVKVVSNYKVMGVAKAALEASARYLADDLGPVGIRVNCISAAPIKTLASSAIVGLRDMLGAVKEKSPLRRNINIEDVGDTAVYLAADLSKNVTGQVIYVDSGLSTLGYSS